MAVDRFGFSSSIVAGEGAADAVRAMTGGDGFDVVFDATGYGPSMEKAFGFVAHGGALVLVSVVKDDIRFSDPEFHKREMMVIGSRNATRVDFEHVADSIAKGLVLRHQQGNVQPLNIIACENMVRGTSQLKQHVFAALPQDEQAWVEQHVGFVDSAVDRIVPPADSSDPLEVTVETFSEWIVDQTQFWSLRNYHCPLDHVSQFTNVACPCVSEKQSLNIRSQAFKL